MPISWQRASRRMDIKELDPKLQRIVQAQNNLKSAVKLANRLGRTETRVYEKAALLIRLKPSVLTRHELVKCAASLRGDITRWANRTIFTDDDDD